MSNKISGVLAHIDSSKTFKVGKYGVNVKQFEEDVIKLFQEVNTFVIIDEIGKMELLSKRFRKIIKKIVLKDISLLATIGLQCMDFYKELMRIQPDIKLFRLEKDNFDTVSGLLIFLTGEIPQRGEEIVYKNLKFTIESASEK